MRFAADDTGRARIAFTRAVPTVQEDDTQDRICGTYFNPPTLADLGWRMVGPRQAAL